MEDFVSVPASFQKWGISHPHYTGYAFKAGDKWKKVDWERYTMKVRRFARSAISDGLGRGEVVAVLAENRPEWVISDMGAMSAGGVSVGVYSTCSPKQVGYILRNCSARIAVVEGEQQLEKVLANVDDLPSLRRIVVMNPEYESEHDLVLNWSEFDELADQTTEAEFQQRMAGIAPDDVSSLVYTSGTTGPPKGVILSHRNLMATSIMGIQMVKRVTPEFKLISYLPLAHVAERGLSLLGPSLLGFAVYFAESLEKLPENLKEVRPQFFLGVPRLWEKMHAVVEPRFETLTGARRKLVFWALKQGRQATIQRMTGRQPGFVEGRKHRLARKLVHLPVLRQLGLDQVTTVITGAAPISVHLLEFFAGLGILIQEVYGLSESGGPVSFNRETATKFGTVGTAFDGAEIMIAEDGEVLAKGNNIFTGYVDDQAATQAVMKGDWFCTGDLGSIDDEGYLTITGRKKDLLITASGKNVSPTVIEEMITDCDLISEAVVVGDRRKFLSALLIVDENVARRSVGNESGGKVDVHGEQICELLQAHIDSVNENLSRAESIKKFVVLKRALQQSTGELTPTLKLVRRVIRKNFAAEIDSMYES